MQKAPPPTAFLVFLFALLHRFASVNGLCHFENGVEARCHELKNVKSIETRDLESLSASVVDSVLDSQFFDNLTNLRHLDLSGGELQRIEPGSLSKLKKLRSLDLADNKIEYLDLATLEGLNQLRSLNLRRNRIEQLPPALLRLKNLRHLDIHGNPFECNCATLKVRDLLVKRGVKLSKKVTCAGPNGLKGTSLLKPETQTICNFEEQDREMQGDQGYEGPSGSGSGDGIDEFDAENDFKDDAELPQVAPTSSSHGGGEEEEEVETPVAQIHQVSSTKEAFIESTTKAKETVDSSTTPIVTTTVASIEKSNGEKSASELFFDTEEKRPTITTLLLQKPIKDSLFYPVEGSGTEEEEEEDEGSGAEDNGSGVVGPSDWSHEDKEERVEATVDGTSVVSSTTGESLTDMLFGLIWGTTAPPDEKKEPDLEEEEFIHASTVKADEEPKETPPLKSITETPTPTESYSSTSVAPQAVENRGEESDMTKMGKVRADVASVNNEMAEVSPAKQSKKGMGSYVVLAGLLGVLGILIGIAAYKSNFCRKKRKRSDLENGTELKDMQKSLLDTGNSAQPKIASNGNPEQMPLVHGTVEEETSKEQMPEAKAQNGNSAELADPVKPPRKTAYSPQEETKPEPQHDGISSKDDSLSARTSPVQSSDTTSPRLAESNGPSVSPAAQRVKITLQENPDSVPKTPILITRTAAGDNLVKSP